MLKSGLGKLLHLKDHLYSKKLIIIIKIISIVDHKKISCETFTNTNTEHQ